MTGADKKISLTALTMTLGSYFSPSSIVVDDNEIVIRFTYETSDLAEDYFEEAKQIAVHDFGEDAYEEEN